MKKFNQLSSCIDVLRERANDLAEGRPNPFIRDRIELEKLKKENVVLKEQINNLMIWAKKIFIYSEAMVKCSEKEMAVESGPK